MAVSSIAPIAPDVPRPILAYSRTTGELIALVPSSSEPNVYHYVTVDGRCSCKGFAYRRSCRHAAPPANDLRDGGAARLQVMRAAGSWPAAASNACGIHGVVHRCHCSSAKSWCNDCPPLGGVR